MQYGYFSQRTGTILGIVFAATALFLAYRNYRDKHPEPAPPHTTSTDTPAHAH